MLVAWSRWAGLALAAVVGTSSVACSQASPEDASSDSASDLTGTTSAERPIHFESQVYVDPNASDDAIRVAIARQVKTAIGALRAPKVSLNDRGAHAKSRARRTAPITGRG